MYTYIPVYLPTEIKKEEANQYLKSQKVSLAVTSLAIAIVIAVMEYFVIPKLTGLYAEMGVTKPLMTQMVEKYAWTVAAGFVLFSIYISSPNFMDSQFEDKIAKYKSGEMIKTKELVRTDAQGVVMLTIGLVVGILIVAIIMPIYNLTNSF